MTRPYPPLSRRDYFAAHALEGLLASPGAVPGMGVDWVLQHMVGFAERAMKALDTPRAGQDAPPAVAVPAPDASDLPTPEEVAGEAESRLNAEDDLSIFMCIADAIREDRSRRVVVQGVPVERLRAILSLPGGPTQVMCDAVEALVNEYAGKGCHLGAGSRKAVDVEAMLQDIYDLGGEDIGFEEFKRRVEPILQKHLGAGSGDGGTP